MGNFSSAKSLGLDEDNLIHNDNDHDSPKWTMVYQQLITMFDNEQLCIKAAQKYPNNIQTAANFVLKHDKPNTTTKSIKNNPLRNEIKLTTPQISDEKNDEKDDYDFKYDTQEIEQKNNTSDINVHKNTKTLNTICQCGNYLRKTTKNEQIALNNDVNLSIVCDHCNIECSNDEFIYYCPKSNDIILHNYGKSGYFLCEKCSFSTRIPIQLNKQISSHKKCICGQVLIASSLQQEYILYDNAELDILCDECNNQITIENQINISISPPLYSISNNDVSRIYHKSWDLLLSGYSKLQIPPDIIYSITVHFVPTITANLIRGCPGLSHYEWEMYMDAFTCSFIKINHYQLTYVAELNDNLILQQFKKSKHKTDMINQFYTSTQYKIGSVNINNFYGNNCFAFTSFHWKFGGSHIGHLHEYMQKYYLCKIAAIDDNNQIIAATEWKLQPVSMPYRAGNWNGSKNCEEYFLSKIANKNHNTLHLNQWLNGLKKNSDYKLSEDDLFDYERFFYYIQYQKASQSSVYSIHVDDFREWVCNGWYCRSSKYESIRQTLIKPIPCDVDDFSIPFDVDDFWSNF